MDVDPARLGRADRLELILERDGARCVWCGAPFDHRRVRPTTEHLVPKVKGGPSWIENEVAACRRCNAARGHTELVRWIEDCEARGWTPDRRVVLDRLRSLHDAIEVRGGQRRARGPLRRALRRLDDDADRPE